MTKKWLVEDYCPVDHYHCLMPVEYESVEQGDIIVEYRKSRMVCRHALAGKCEQVKDCTFFEASPETLPKNENWYEG